ncbi:MAG: DUF4912 domain-containing protein [Candidatus Omnitrophica bacterium]|nr:DUF4912 domain-containing protein [Candidatus Omnitrophota bacterium]
MSTIPNKKNSKKPFVDSLDLPASYNCTRLTLIPRDPYWLYAYWEIAPSSIEEMKKQLGAEFDRAAYVLRIYDVGCIDFNGSNANRQFDIDIGRDANNWCVNLWNDNVSLCADLGMRLPDGRFFKLARSNFTTTPRANPSGRHEQAWMNVETGKKEGPYVFGEIKRGAGNPHVKKNNPRSRKISLTENDVKQYYSQLSPLLKDVISERLSRERALSVGRKHGPGYSNRVDVNLRSSWDRNFPAGKFAPNIKFGSSGETLSSGASEQNVPDNRNRKFFFELGTELIVYGRTEPDAKVYHEGKNVALRGDGTFSMRFALPDGRIPLGFEAVSGDSVEKRKISTAAIREKTRYA